MRFLKYKRDLKGEVSLQGSSAVLLHDSNEVSLFYSSIADTANAVNTDCERKVAPCRGMYLP